jgi:hypothetical protein
VKGTGDGYYGAGSIISISADPAPVDYIFDRWTGATPYVANVLAPTTYVTTATQSLALTATYRLAPAVDADGDGLRDAWEVAHFGSIGVASGASDFDADGLSDGAEFLAGTAPTDPHSRLVLDLSRTPGGDLLLRWDGVAGERYTIESKADLSDDTWVPLSIGIAGVAPSTSCAVPSAAVHRFLRVRVE